MSVPNRLLVPLAVGLHIAITRCTGRLASERGQATAEYALVLLGAAVVAIALVTWATGSGRVGQLFDAVFDDLQGRL